METPENRSSRPRESVKRRMVWLGLFIVSVAGLVIMTISGIQQRNYVNCNARQVEILIQYQREASIAAREEREATDVVRVAQRSGDRQAELKAIDRYFEISKQTDARRARTPLPELPQSVCGKEPSASLR
jgi:hypothetical protein